MVQRDRRDLLELRVLEVLPQILERLGLLVHKEIQV
jgi:hypothetical protein